MPFVVNIKTDLNYLMDSLKPAKIPKNIGPHGPVLISHFGKKNINVSVDMPYKVNVAQISMHMN